WARPDDDAARFRLDLHDIERIAIGDTETTALPDGEMHRALVTSKAAAIFVDDIAWLGRIGPELRDEIAIAALGDETYVLAVGLVGDGEAKLGRNAARFALGQRPQGKAKIVDLLLGR